MQPRGQFETSVDAGRNEAVLKRADPERSRVRSLAARGLAALLLVFFAALLALPLQAQSAVLVSNLGQTNGGGGSLGSFDQAQAFTTGDNNGGYTLTSVEIQTIGTPTLDRLTVSIRSDSSGSPDASLGTLTNPASLPSDGLATFTASGAGIDLEKETTYFVLVDVTGGPGGSIQNTASDNEDANPATNWSIGDTSLYRNKDSNGSWTSFADSKKIRINGTVGGTTPTLSTDATLSGLALADNSGTAITLSPSTFVSTTKAYTAAVANSIDEITITPTVNESNATYEIQNASGTALTDADTNTTGFQVDLTVGATTIKVEVTAEDGTTETYQVTVTRATATTPTGCETGDIWCATMTVAELSALGLTLGHGYNSALNQGALSHDEFEYDGTNYTVSGLIVTPGFDTPLRIGFDPSGETVFNTDSFFLYVDGTAFLFNDATFVSGDQFQWTSARLSWSIGDTVELRLVERSGTAATGKPTISGTARVGQTLTADTSGIADADGLTSPTYTYQWIRVQNLVETEISGATASTYTPVADDVGKTIRVKVTFSDDAGNPENSTSDAYPSSGTVATASTVPTPTPGGPAEVAVPSDWSLIPAGLGPGDKFRLLFLSSTKRNASSSSISTYNSFIQGRAAAGHADIREYSDQFRVIGCTDTLNATDNTNTRSSDTDAPIYWLLGGNKVANNYEDFYDGSWDNEGNRKNELGTTGLNTSEPSNYPWTGCDHHGVEAFSLANVSEALGTGAAQVGRLNDSGSDIGPLYGGVVATTNLTRPMYGLSPVFIVPVPTKVRFGSTGYHAIEGGAEATVVVVMYPRPSTQVDIPLTVTSLGSTSATDYQIFVDGREETSDRFSLTFSPEDRSGIAGGVPKSFTVKALTDSANDHRESVRFGFGSMPISTTIEGVTDGRAAKTATVWLLESQTEMMACTTPDTSAPNLGTLLTASNPRRLNSKGQIKNSGDCVWFKVNLANNRSHQFLLTGRWVHGVLSQITSPQIKIYNSDGTLLVQDQVLEADRRFRAPIVEFTPATTGNYYVRASSLGYDVGHFTISYRDIGPGTAPATAAEPLTATLEDIPTNHDGSSAFTFRIAFSAAVEITPEDMRDHALVVSGGTVTTAARVDDRKDLWELTVDPAGTAAVTILVPLDRACTETGALCTADGVMLTTAPGHSVPGPAPVPQGQQALAPLAASFVSVPPEHDGETAFWLELSFNAAVVEGSKPRIRALLGASGGSVTKVRRKDDRLDRWRIQIQPSSHAAVTVTLSPSPACGTTGAVCTEDGRTYTTALATRINGPVGVSVADTTVQEGADAHLDFVVSLSRAAASTVTVNYRTRNGTAIAGQDFTGTSGTLTFAAGETAKTVAVAVLDDVHDEGSETMKLKLANASGGRITDKKAIGTITNSDPLQRAWLSRFGRTVGTHVTDAVGERLRTPPGQASQVTVGGYRLPLGRQAAGRDPETTDPATTTKPETATDRLAALLTGLVGQALGLGPAQPEGGGLGADPWADQPGTDPRLGQSQLLQLPTVRVRDVLLGSSFRLALAGDDARDGAMRLTAWGRVAGTRFDGRDGVLSLDGDVFTGTVGIDGTWGRWLLGLAAAHTQADGTFAGDGMSDRGQGTLDNTLTSIHPYVQYAVTDRLNLWGMVGYGWGDTEVTIGHTEILESDTNFLMGAVGGRGVLLAAAETGGFELATRSDAMLTQTSLDDTAGMAGAEGAAHRLRVVLEGSRGFTWPEGRTLTPTLEVGLRHDWGDAETGFGLEVGGRVQYADPRLGLTVDGTVRGLVAHEASEYDEWGASANVRLAPGMNGQGLSLTLSPTWGAASSGIDGLWSRQTTVGLAPQGARAAPTGRLNAEVSYGFTPFGPGLLTPYAGTVLTDGAARTYRLGTRWTSISGLTLNLEGQRQAPAADQPINQGLYLQIGWGF